MEEIIIQGSIEGERRKGRSLARCQFMGNSLVTSECIAEDCQDGNKLLVTFTI